MTNKYKDSKLSIDARLNDLISIMSVEEKVAQLAGIWASEVIDIDTRGFVKERAKQVIPLGIGHVARIGAVSMLPPEKTAEIANQLQEYLLNETRLGLPAIVHEESCAGYLAKDATSFPQEFAK
jgi:beta-glucosidase